MNNKKRKLFWDALCSADGCNIDEDIKNIKETIEYPRFLYRYRGISLSSVDALQRNILPFSTANYYDDPFDTLIKIDFKEIYNHIQVILQQDDIEEALVNFGNSLDVENTEVNKARNIIQSLSPSETAMGVIEYLKNNYQSALKRNLWSVCFSESGLNETLWLKYAQNHEGFCVVYDLDDNCKWLCGKQEKCKNCIVNQHRISLYPIYYSDDGYDATNYLKNYVLEDISKKHLDPLKSTTVVNMIREMPWEIERIALNKSKCHEYDKEWRLLLNGRLEEPIMIEWVPHAVILGLKMEELDRNIIIRSTKMAGIEHIYETYIDDTAKLNLREV